MTVGSALAYAFGGFIGMYIWLGIPYLIYRVVRNYLFRKEEDMKLVTKKGFYTITIIGGITGTLMFISGL
jgi:hypothetical protein